MKTKNINNESLEQVRKQNMAKWTAEDYYFYRGFFDMLCAKDSADDGGMDEGCEDFLKKVKEKVKVK